MGSPLKRSFVSIVPTSAEKDEEMAEVTLFKRPHSDGLFSFFSFFFLYFSSLSTLIPIAFV